MARSANYYKVTAAGDNVDAAPPEELVSDILSLRPSDWEVPPLQNVIECPALRPDGTVLEVPGYDPATGLFYAPNDGLTAISIPQKPTQDQIVAALRKIQELWGAFSNGELTTL